MNTKRMHILFSGRVQGVGFRYTVCRISKRFKITGSVRNLPDGDVEVVAKGTETELMDFFNAIRTSSLSRFITGEQVSWSAATSEQQHFGISY